MFVWPVWGDCDDQCVLRAVSTEYCARKQPSLPYRETPLLRIIETSSLPQKLGRNNSPWLLPLSIRATGILLWLTSWQLTRLIYQPTWISLNWQQACDSCVCGSMAALLWGKRNGSRAFMPLFALTMSCPSMTSSGMFGQALFSMATEIRVRQLSRSISGASRIFFTDLTARLAWK